MYGFVSNFVVAIPEARLYLSKYFTARSIASSGKYDTSRELTISTENYYLSPWSMDEFDILVDGPADRDYSSGFFKG